MGLEKTTPRGTDGGDRGRVGDGHPPGGKKIPFFFFFSPSGALQVPMEVKKTPPLPPRVQLRLHLPAAPRLP